MDKYNGKVGMAEETIKGNGDGDGWKASSDNREGRWHIRTSLP